MDRLSYFLTLITGAVLVGGLVSVVLSMGYYAWLPIAGAAAVGLVLTWPTAYAISRLIKRDDPGWRLRSGARGNQGGNESGFPET